MTDEKIVKPAVKAKKPRPAIKAKKKKTAEKVEPTIDAESVIEGEIIDNEEEIMTDTTADNNNSTSDTTEDETLRATRGADSHQAKRDNQFMDRDWGDFGTRVLFNFLYGFLATVAFSLALVLGFTQLIVMIIQDEPNDSIKEWSVKLSDYIQQSIAYICWQSDDKPFPFEGNQD